MTATINKAPAVLPMTPRVKRYMGIPMTAASPKQISWRFVRFSAILVLTLDRSLGTVTKAIA